MNLDDLEAAIRLSKDAGHSKIALHLNVLEAIITRLRKLEDPIQMFGPRPGRKRDRMEVRDEVVG